jgi:hypothetical protein
MCAEDHAGRPGDGTGHPSDPGDDAAGRFFAGRPLARAVFERVRAVVEAAGGCEIRVSKSQVAFRRRRGFAFLWLPDRYLARPAAEVVLTVALGRADRSPRWKEVVHPARNQWIHHLEMQGPAAVDDEVARWLREAAERAD